MQQSNTDIFYKKMILAGFLLLMLIHLLLVFCGFYGGDDINFARYAADAANHGINLTPATDQFQLRWVTVYSTAVFYKLFGMTAFTSSLSSFLSFIGCGILLYKILKESNLKIYLLSMTLFFFSQSIIFYSHRLLADPAVCFAALWMYYAYRCFYLKNEHAFRYALYFASALLIAIMAKETIIIIVPLFAVLFLYDIFRKQRITFWKYAALLSILFVFLYLLYFKIATGDFLYRYHVLLANGYFTDCSYDQLPFIYTLKRIGYELWKAMLLNGDLLVYIPAVAALIYRKKIGLNKPDAIAFLILLLSANFMSISFTHYVPLCYDPRHFIFLIPFAAICGGPILHAYFKEPKRFILLPLTMLIAAIIIFDVHGGNTKYLYLLFAVLLAGAYFAAFVFKGKSLLNIFIVGLLLLFSLNYFVGFIKPMYPFYKDQKKMVEAHFADKNQHATVYSADEISGELNEFFLKFNTGNVVFKPLDSAKGNAAEPIYLMINSTLNPSIKAMTDSLLKAYPEKQITLDAQENNIYLYKVNNDFLQALIRVH
jgi:4-amino-4-deoxy-L-arabinose transferase-like glycosyltransferase